MRLHRDADFIELDATRKFTKGNHMASIQGDNVRKGPLVRLRALLTSILSTTAEEEVRLQRQDLLKVIAKSASGRAVDGQVREWKD